MRTVPLPANPRLTFVPVTGVSARLRWFATTTVTSLPRTTRSTDSTFRTGFSGRLVGTGSTETSAALSNADAGGADRSRTGPSQERQDREGTVMTTTVTKGTNRPGATARRNRHAQTTPLPPRPGQVEAARAEVPEPIDSRTHAADLRTRAEALGIRLPKSATKARIIEALQAADAQAEQDRPAQPSEAHGDATERDPKGYAKAEKFQAVVATYGWSGEILARPGAEIEVIVRRGDEVIAITWIAGVFNYEASAYVVGDRSVRPRNVSAARGFAARAPEAAVAELTRVVANRAWKRKVDQPVRTGKLPFDPERATDDEVLEAVRGRTVTWFNRISTQTEAGHVSPNGRWTEIREVNGERVLQFCGPVGGFRTCRVASILSVGRRKA